MKRSFLRSRMLLALLAGAAVVTAAVLLWEGYGLLGPRLWGPTPFPTNSTHIAANNQAGSPSSATTTPAETATPTLTPTPSNTATPGPSPTPSKTPTATPTPSNTPTATSTPTSLPWPTRAAGFSTPGILEEGSPTPPTPIPSPVPTFEIPADTTNILLLGNDSPLGETSARSDTMILVTINQSGPTASMISIPRDLFVYIPGGTMNRINTAVTQGGIDLLRRTILYNLGIPVHYYARIDFQGFMDVVDAMGGLEIPVGCKFHDWRLISPELDPQLEESWAQFTLEPGVYHMDGDLALWYARSRLSTNDFYRGRRQQQLLRAILNQGIDLDMLGQVPTLWEAFKDNIETDIDLGRMLQLAAMAPAIRETGVSNHYLTLAVDPWTVPDTGAYVQLPVWQGEGRMEEAFRRFLLPPTLSRASHPPIYVEIINATGNPDMAVLAADNLAWYGFVPVITPDEVNAQLSDNTQTRLRYFGPNFKGSYDWLFSWIFSKGKSQIELVSDQPDYPYQYQAILGQDYVPCLDQFYAPQPYLEENETP